MTKFIGRSAIGFFSLIFVGCVSLTIEPYQPTAVTTDILSHAIDNYSVGTVSGQTGVQSDQLLKASLPCRLESFKMPSQQPVHLYIENALNAELRAAEKLAAPEGRRIDIVVVKLESDTSKTHNGRWTLDFIYKIGRISRDIQSVTDYPFNANANIACRNMADSFDNALRENFRKFFKTL